MDLRAERIGRNEALFRDVNERIKDVSEADGEMEILCECGDTECTTTLRITPGEYEGLRADPTRFAAAHGHEAPDVGQVIYSNDRYSVVEKIGEATRIARETDPRR
jgi:hypothetical protein